MKKLFIPGATGIIIWLLYQFPNVMLSPGKLVEGHQDLKEKCYSCHEPFWGIENRKCILCHKLSEIGKDTSNLNDTKVSDQKILFHDKLLNQKCSSCHTDHQGLKPDLPLKTFTHEILSESIFSNCNGCHIQPSDMLHSQLSTACRNCHNVNGWKSSVIFNHEMIQGINKNNCVSCHQKPNDSYHSKFEDNCNKCHTLNKWIPSSMDHSSYFQLDKNHNAKCNTCHTGNNFSSYTCYGCHEHSENKIIKEHDEQSISNLNDCVSCHKSGNEHEIEKNGKPNSNNESLQKEMNNQDKNSEKKKDNKKPDRNGDDDDNDDD